MTLKHHPKALATISTRITKRLLQYTRSFVAFISLIVTAATLPQIVGPTMYLSDSAQPRYEVLFWRDRDTSSCDEAVTISRAFMGSVCLTFP